MTTDFQFAAGQILGDRDNQEDTCIIATEASLIRANGKTILRGACGESLLAVLCDGMGGHAKGEIAASIASEQFVTTFRQTTNESRGTADRLLRAYLDANKAICNRVQLDISTRGMGTTLVGIWIEGKRLNWISVGDSHLLLFRQGKLIKLNQDHSMRPVVERMVRRGMIARAEALSHPERNALRSVLNGSDPELIDQGVADFVLHRGDLLIMASDGLDVVPVNEILRILSRRFFNSPSIITKNMLQATERIDQGQLDNTTIAILRIR